jgi:transcriptional regulator with XRE-family HTH domain
MPSRSAPTTWENYAKELGVELQRRRIDRGITQEDLAHLAGLTRTHYQQIERGSWTKDAPSNPSTKIMARLAQAVDLEIGDLTPSVAKLTRDDKKRHPE